MGKKYCIRFNKAMLLYKYRTLSNPESALDILLNQRLHCSRYLELNDPFEGLFLETLGISVRKRPVTIPFGSFGLFVPSDKSKQPKLATIRIVFLPIKLITQIDKTQEMTPVMPISAVPALGFKI